MSYLQRIVVDGTDHEAWRIARRTGVIGASTAAKFAKPSSVELYLAAMLAPATFSGNGFTESGHRWEPMMLAYADIPQNLALFHSPHERGFTATPDGVRALPDGRVRLAECKAKHGKVVDGPDASEWRQLAWQFEVFPEADAIEFLWVELTRNERGDWDLRPNLHGLPKRLVVTRDHPKIVAARALVVPIATEVLARLRVALSYERSAA
jgi:hypothetical protein